MAATVPTSRETVKTTSGMKSARDSGWARASARNGALNSRSPRDDTPSQTVPTRGHLSIKSNPMTKGVIVSSNGSGLGTIPMEARREPRTPAAV